MDGGTLKPEPSYSPISSTPSASDGDVGIVVRVPVAAVYETCNPDAMLQGVARLLRALPGHATDDGLSAASIAMCNTQQTATPPHTAFGEDKKWRRPTSRW